MLFDISKTEPKKSVNLNVFILTIKFDINKYYIGSGEKN